MCDIPIAIYTLVQNTLRTEQDGSNWEGDVFQLTFMIKCH